VLADVQGFEEPVLQDEVLLLLLLVSRLGVGDSLLRRVVNRKIREIRFFVHDAPPRKRPPERGVANEDIESRADRPKSLWRPGDSARVHAQGRPPDRPLPRILRSGSDEGPGPARRKTVGRRIHHGSDVGRSLSVCCSPSAKLDVTQSPPWRLDNRTDISTSDGL